MQVRTKKTKFYDLDGEEEYNLREVMESECKKSKLTALFKQLTWISKMCKL